MARKYLKIFFDFDERAGALTSEEQGRLLLALLRYAATGEKEELAGNERFLYPCFCVDIDRDGEVYESKITKLNQTKPEETKPNQAKPEETSIKNKNKIKIKNKYPLLLHSISPKGKRALAHRRLRLQQHFCFLAHIFL